MRCGLASIIGASSIVGRATPLEMFVLAIVSTFAFELNRQIVANVSIDQFGSFTVFGFGGFVSLGTGLIYLCIEKKKRTLKELSALNSTSSLSLLGSLFIFLLVPILAF